MFDLGFIPNFAKGIWNLGEFDLGLHTDFIHHLEFRFNTLPKMFLVVADSY